MSWLGLFVVYGHIYVSFPNKFSSVDFVCLSCLCWLSSCFMSLTFRFLIWLVFMGFECDKWCVFKLFFYVKIVKIKKGLSFYSFFLWESPRTQILYHNFEMTIYELWTITLYRPITFSPIFTVFHFIIVIIVVSQKLYPYTFSFFSLQFVEAISHTTISQNIL